MIDMVFKAEVTEGLNLEVLTALSDASRTLNCSCLVVLKYDKPSIIFGVFHTKKQVQVDTYVCEQGSLFYSRFYKHVGMSDKEYYFIVSNRMTGAIKESCEPVKLSLNDELSLYPSSYKNNNQTSNKTL